MNKWNYDTHKYEPFESPAKVMSLYSEDMDEPVNCANCGRRMTYGDCYTSQTIHNKVGFGYPVCGDCYAIETADRKAHNEKMAH